MSQKKKDQLGMNPSTAQARLLKDILFKLVVDTNQDNCYHCGEPLDRESFSIEHKVPWLDSENPLDLFFDLNNISFSHLSCNVKASRGSRKDIPHGTTSGYDYYKCRCSSCKTARSERDRATWNTKENRRARYLRTGS